MKSFLVAIIAFIFTGCSATQVGTGEKAGGGTALVCHKGNKTMELPQEAVRAHLDHGDRMGPC